MKPENSESMDNWGEYLGDLQRKQEPSSQDLRESSDIWGEIDKKFDAVNLQSGDLKVPRIPGLSRTEPSKGKKKKSKGFSGFGNDQVSRLEAQLAQAKAGLRQCEAELNAKNSECSTLRGEAEDQESRMNEMMVKNEINEKKHLASLATMTEEHAIKVDQMTHKIRMLELDNRSLLDQMNIFDSMEVELHNRELRKEVQSLHEDKLESTSKMGALREEQRKAVIHLKYQLEREFRARLRTAEERVKVECLKQVKADARSAIIQRDKLTEFIYKMGNDLTAANHKFALMDKDNEHKGIELCIADDMHNEQARMAVVLRKQIEKLERENEDLKRNLDDAQKELANMVKEHGGGDARPWSAATSSSSVSLIADFHALEEKYARLEQKYRGVYSERDRMSERCAKLEMANLRLREVVSKSGDKSNPAYKDELMRAEDNSDYRSIWKAQDRAQSPRPSSSRPEPLPGRAGASSSSGPPSPSQDPHTSELLRRSREEYFGAAAAAASAAEAAGEDLDNVPGLGPSSLADRTTWHDSSAPLDPIHDTSRSTTPGSSRRTTPRSTPRGSTTPVYQVPPQAQRPKSSYPRPRSSARPSDPLRPSPVMRPQSAVSQLLRNPAPTRNREAYYAKQHANFLGGHQQLY